MSTCLASGNSAPRSRQVCQHHPLPAQLNRCSSPTHPFDFILGVVKTLSPVRAANSAQSPLYRSVWRSTSVRGCCQYLPLARHKQRDSSSLTLRKKSFLSKKRPSTTKSEEQGVAQGGWLLGSRTKARGPGKRKCSTTHLPTYLREKVKAAVGWVRRAPAPKNVGWSGVLGTATAPLQSQYHWSLQALDTPDLFRPVNFRLRSAWLAAAETGHDVSYSKNFFQGLIGS